MSTTYSLACETCRDAAKTYPEWEACDLWVGQTSCGGPFRLYRNDKELLEMQAFIWKHQGHTLRLVNDLSDDVPDRFFDSPPSP